MKTPTALALASAVLLPMALAACLGSADDPAPRKLSCAEVSDSVFPGIEGNGARMYRVLAPNGGETFRVGETMRVRVAGANAGDGSLEIIRFFPGGNVRAKLPGSPDTSFNPRSACEFAFTVPESLATGSGLSEKISLVSDSIRIRFFDYNNGADYYDYSDSLFRIIAKPPTTGY